MGPGACGLKHMPVEVLSKIAEQLDLATQVSLWQTNKYLCKSLGGEVQFVKLFDSKACSVPLDLRCSTEAFALCGIELLMNLPPAVSLSDSRVQMRYSDGHRRSRNMASEKKLQQTAGFHPCFWSSTAVMIMMEM